MDKVIYQTEKLDHVLLDEMYPLFERHREELVPYPDFVLSPDWERYFLLDENDVLRVYTARKAGRLIGYSVFYICSHLHYRDRKQAVQDLLFLLPEHRGSMAGYRLIKYCDQQLELEGVDVVCCRTKVKQDYGPILEKLGYTAVERTFEKRLT